jgi:hypothetical protein
MNHRTLKGGLAGGEPDEALYFCFSASLRIFGKNLPFEVIAEHLRVAPTHQHRAGQRRSESAPEYTNDGWLYQSPLPEAEALQHHIQAIWSVVRPNIPYLKELKQRYEVDVFCGYRTNCDHAGLEVPHDSLEIFSALEVPFSVSVVVI